MKRNIVLLPSVILGTRGNRDYSALSSLRARFFCPFAKLHPAFACASHVSGNRDEHLVHAICFHCIRLKNGYRLPQKRIRQIFQNIIINFRNNVFNFIFEINKSNKSNAIYILSEYFNKIFTLFFWATKEIPELWRRRIESGWHRIRGLLSARRGFWRKVAGNSTSSSSDSTDSIWLPCWKFREKVIALTVGRDLERTSLSQMSSNPESISPGSFFPEHPILQTLEKMCIPMRGYHMGEPDRSCESNLENSYRVLAIRKTRIDYVIDVTWVTIE